jgi:zinc/manganese transport system permease protein
VSFSFETVNLLAPAFMVGAVLSLAHVPLGAEVLKRGIIFLDLAVAQFAALGMTAFHVFIENHDMDPQYAAIGSLLCGLVFAVVSAMGLHALEKHSGRHHEAMIGSAFILAASLGILLMAGDPHGGEQMKDIMAGQILWVTWEDFFFHGPIFLVVAALWNIFKNARRYLFYILFALTIPFSVKLIGVYLVFASLILPALATVKMGRFKQASAYLLSVASFGMGLVISYFLDAPSGPAIVLTMFAFCFGFIGIRKFRSKT